MPEKTKCNNNELRYFLKDNYKINFNITNCLSPKEKEEVIRVLESNEAMQKLVRSFVLANNRLAGNNKKFGKQRSAAERDLEDSKRENNKLNTEISQLRLKYKQLKQMLHDNLEAIHGALFKNIANRSELLQLISAAKSIVEKKAKVNR